MSGHIAHIVTSFIEIPGQICSSVFFTGCPFFCNGCQNSELQKLNAGKLISTDEVVDNVSNNNLASWVCFLGGEPFYQPEILFDLCKKIDKPIGIYTGYNFDDVSKKFEHIINIPNVLFLKTGKFDMEELCATEFPITANQCVYLKKSNIWKKCAYRTIAGVSTEIIRTIM